MFKKHFISACFGVLCFTSALASPHHHGFVDSQGKDAFSKPVSRLSPLELEQFTLGNRVFNTHWVIAPASVARFDGLGPLFNSLSCSGCHFKDGRGRPPIDGEKMLSSMLIRLSVPGETADGGPKPHPAYGGQLNDKAIPGVYAEGRVNIIYEEQNGRYPDGTSYSLRKPTYQLTNLRYGSLDGVLTSPRVAPQVYGLGLLEAISEADILANVDPNDANKDGISGRANWLGKETKQLGRFGWKANQPSLKSQDAGAMLGDMGITSSVNPSENCTAAQKSCKDAPLGKELDLSDKDLAALTFYTQTLAVPKNRVTKDSVLGNKLFASVGCSGCHTPSFKTGKHAVQSLSEQEISPYTDLLLHDMGDELADHRPDYQASGREWRTAPLWGIGLIPEVNKHSFLLHDGRARNIEEAILWHGGEGLTSKENFMALEKSEREALIKFVEKL